MSTRIEGTVTAIIVAAGRSDRMGGLDKVFADLMGRPLITWTLRAFKACESVDSIIVVASPNSVDRMSSLVREWRFDSKVTAVVAGGDHRQASVRSGLDACPSAKIVAVHDGARPLVTSEIIDAGIELARTARAAVCAVPSRDTVKRVATATNIVQETPPRDGLWLAQTPQCFDRILLLEAHARAKGSATDDAALVEALGQPVTAYEGAWSNLKVTTQEDLVVAEALLRERFAST